MWSSRCRWLVTVGTGVVVAAAAASVGAAAPSASARQPLVVQPTQETVRLLSAHRVASAPRAGPAKGRIVPASRPLTGEQTVLPVLGRATAANGARWLRVLVPGRPNGATGWIAERGTVLTTSSWHVVIKTSSRRVRVYRQGRLVRSFLAVVGKSSTPTPFGRFFVEEKVRMRPGHAGGPFALALSARSTVFQEFEGGPGQVAVHGVANLGGTPGTAISHGCVRLANDNIVWLAARIGAGVPVTITS
jgi:lipoprotein-anchoring transpeptidase ErfK/SrfK